MGKCQVIVMNDEERMQAEFLNIQNSLKDRVNCTDRLEVSEIRTVAGVDLAYWNENGEEYAVCCIVVIDAETHEVIEKQQYHGKIEVPYMAGFLAFRELPLVLETVKKLNIKPDLFMFDGNGYLHPRHMGLATHFTFYYDTVSIGVAKTYFRADRKTDYTEPDTKAGSYTDIVMDGEVYGKAVRTHDGVKPVFVSAGNNISLDTAVRIVLGFTDRESRVPIPTRLADLETHRAREILRGGIS